MIHPHDHYLHHDAFCPLEVDGSVVTWGEATSGGKSSEVAQHLKTGVVSVA